MDNVTPGRYDSRHYISECDCDFALRLNMGGLLRLVQTAATRHCTLIGIGPEKYEETHTAFLLAKLCARSYQDIPAGEEVEVSTRPSSAIRAVYHRYTTVRLGDGTLAAAVDARWVLVDTQTRRILRRTPPEFGTVFDGIPLQGEEFPVQIARPEAELTFLGEEKALYSRCDQNGHINNTRYADMICDHLPLELFSQGPMRELRISYHREVPMGKAMGLWSHQTGPKEYYFLGRSGEQDCFEAMASF